MSGSDSSSSGKGEIKEEDQDEEEHTVTTLFGTKKVATKEKIMARISTTSAAIGEGASRMKKLYKIDIMPAEGNAPSLQRTCTSRFQYRAH